MTTAETLSRESLLDRMASGAAVLTANQRLARSLLAAFDEHMAATGVTAWPTPMVLHYGTWLRGLWRDAALSGAAALPRLLTPEQEIQLWCEAIRRDGRNLLRVTATAQRAQQAWATLRAWRLPSESGAFAANENSRAFRRWARRFTRLLDEQGLISAADLESRLCGLLGEGRVEASGAYLLFGFYELAPGQAGLLSALERQGCAVSWISLAGAHGNVCRLRAEDGAGELRLAAAWARQGLESAPGARIGIVVPDLAERRPALERALNRALSPTRHVPGKGIEPPPWNVSLGRSLAAYPVIETALQLLHLMEPVFSLDRVSALLTSPWWGLPGGEDENRAERSRRALLDAALRQRGDERVSLRTWRFRARSRKDGAPARPWHSSGLAARLDALIRLQEGLPAAGTCAEWAEHVSAWLAAAGWCSGRMLDSVAYQALERWAGLLASFSALDEFTAPLDRGSARRLLAQMAGEAVFQPESPGVPIQVLGVHESNEQHFDRLWVMGLHDGQWPPAPSPDPFIPAELQREHGLPNRDPAWTLDRARLLTERWARAADQVVLSFPARDGDEPLQASPLLEVYAEGDAASLIGPGAAGGPAQPPGGGGLEPAPERSLPPLEAEAMRGGAGVLRSFSRCPFRGQAEYRLGALPLRRVAPGLDPMRRGQLVHRMLELFWRRTRSQAELLALDAGTLTAHIEEAVDTALSEFSRRSPFALRPRHAALERARLVRLASEWLDVERRRAPFRVVGFEQEAWVTTGGGSLRVFLDRIDALDDGGLVIVDYKTGTVTAGDWFGDRPGDPQLPLYSLALDPGELAGLCFGRVRGGECGFNGVVAREDLLPGLPPPRSARLVDAMEHWPRVLEDWAQTLSALVAAYRSGRDEVHPQHGPRTCRETHCELAPLCRIHTAAGPEDEA